MFSRLREHLGTAGLVVAIVALVAALGGAAVAADGGSGGKATASAKTKKGPRGPKGPKGDTGPAGPAGPAGTTGRGGANGEDGENGKAGGKGKDGTSGIDGRNVTVAAEPSGAHCAEGGASFEEEDSGAKQYACNGLEGAKGDEGSPWTDLGTLPPGETETGSWTIGPNPINEYVASRVPISFPIPLAVGLDSAHVHYVNQSGEEEGAPSSHCQGSAATPSASAGHLCVYAAPSSEQGEVIYSNESITRADQEASGTAAAGAFLGMVVGFNGSAFGTWAVTECPASDPAPC